MHRVQSQSIEMIFSKPIEGVLNKEVAHRSALRAIEVDAVSPGSSVAVGEKLGSVSVKIISFRTKMVINNVEQNHHSALVGALNQLFKILGAAVACCRVRTEKLHRSPNFVRRENQLPASIQSP